MAKKDANDAPADAKAGAVEAGKKRRVVKKSETVREKRAKAADVKPTKRRRVRQAAGKANRPVRAAGRGIAKAVSPLGFVLRPFRTRPFRLLGRILYKVLGIGYFVNSWRELRLVEWPNRSETAKLTLAVFVFAAAIASFIAALDYGLDKVFRELLT